MKRNALAQVAKLTVKACNTSYTVTALEYP
jgi:hypothetical protein